MKDEDRATEIEFGVLAVFVAGRLSRAWSLPLGTGERSQSFQMG
jgi:hypothetical protein